MASNYHENGTGSAVVTFSKPVGLLNISVLSGTFSLSLNGGADYLTLPTGFHNLPVGPILEVFIDATGDWHIIGVQA